METRTYIDWLTIKDTEEGTDGQPGAEAHGVCPEEPWARGHLSLQVGGTALLAPGCAR